jgi:fibronectin type 3 domain-containing protein
VQRVVNAALGGPCITNTVPSPHSVLLTWTPSVSGNVIGSNVYRGTTAGGPYTKINSSPVSGNSYTDTTVQNGVTYFYVVTAVSNTGAESGYSNMGTAPVPST